MKKILLLINFITLKCFAVSDLYAGNESIKEVLNNDLYTPNYFKMILGLFFVIGLVYLTGIIYQKLTKIRISKDNVDMYKAEIVSTTSLGQGKNIHVVKIMNEYVLIGSTQNNISFLKNLENIKKYEGC